MDFMSVVHQAIEDGICNGGVSDVFMPVLDRQLGSYDGGSDAVSVLDDLQEVSTLRCTHGGQAQIIDDQDVGLE